MELILALFAIAFCFNQLQFAGNSNAKQLGNLILILLLILLVFAPAVFSGQPLLPFRHHVGP